MMRFKTLEEFLEHSCGMASSQLVFHYELHREWVEACLMSYEYIRCDDEYEEHIEGLWIALPEPPKEFFYRGGN